MIDTTRVDPVTPKMMEDLKVRAFLASNALYIENEGRVEALDLSNGAASVKVGSGQNAAHPLTITTGSGAAGVGAIIP